MVSSIRDRLMNFNNWSMFVYQLKEASIFAFGVGIIQLIILRLSYAVGWREEYFIFTPQLISCVLAAAGGLVIGRTFFGIYHHKNK
jgi:hypothetical protein